VTDFAVLIMARISQGPADAMMLFAVITKAAPTLSLDARQRLYALHTSELEADGLIVRHEVGCWHLPPPKTTAPRRLNELRPGTVIPKKFAHLTPYMPNTGKE
jgi:hypothetical protein